MSVYNSSICSHILDITIELLAILMVGGIQHVHYEGNKAIYCLAMPSVKHKTMRVWSVDHPYLVGDILLISDALAS